MALFGITVYVILCSEADRFVAEVLIMIVAHVNVLTKLELRTCQFHGIYIPLG